MKQNIKEEIKGALISSGLWILAINFIPFIHNLDTAINHSVFIGLGLIALGAFWLK